MKKAIFIVYCLLFTVCHSFAQVPADSLPGTYAGQYWLANPYTNPWVITPDTVYISNIDSVNCKTLYADKDTIHFYGNPTYYTDYYSCNGIAPSNYYTKFYNMDSIRIIIDDEPQPPPNQPRSWRFYGKRINNKIVGLTELENIGVLVEVYPNPSSSVFIIKDEKLDIIDVDVYNVYGECVYQTSNQAINKLATIDLSKDAKGIYFLQIKSQQGIVSKKILIEK